MSPIVGRAATALMNSIIDGTSGVKMTIGRTTPLTCSARASSTVATPYPHGSTSASARAIIRAPSP